MHWGELESVAACHVPGQGALEIQRLSTGLVNETYRVLRDGSAHALRVAAAGSRDLGLDRAWEARVLKSAGAADLAPALEYCDPQRGILIARWIDGRSWSPADVRLQSNIRRMAEFMRRIHALPMPEPARVMSPTTWIAHYRAAVRRSVPDSNAGAPPNATADTRAADALRTAATARLAALAALPSVDPVVCHSDLHALNLVDRGVSLALLDWEYAHAADPLWDLAGWSANNDFDDGLTHDLLTRYAGRPPTHDECLRLRLLAWLYDYVCLLWSELYLNLHRAGAGAGVRGAGMQSAAMQSDPARDDIAARARLLAVRLDASK